MTERNHGKFNYEPRSKGSFLVPALIIAAALILVAILVVVLVTRDDGGDDTAAEEEQVELEEQEEESTATNIPEPPSNVGGIPDDEEPAEDETESDDLEDEDESETDELSPPDTSQIEAAAHEWLKDKVGDPDVILVRPEDLDDMDAFFDLYDLTDDNVVVYMVDSLEDEFLTVLFGPPYSEWGLMAVFIWRNNQWEFLREQDVEMGV